MRRIRGAALLLGVLAGCSQTELMPPPGVVVLAGISVTAVATINVGQSASGQVPVTVGRLAGYTGPIQLSVEGLQAGVTGTFAPATVPAASTTSTLTLAASATATVGTVLATIRAKGTGVNDATVQVLVTIAP